MCVCRETLQWSKSFSQWTQRGKRITQCREVKVSCQPQTGVCSESIKLSWPWKQTDVGTPSHSECRLSCPGDIVSYTDTCRQVSKAWPHEPKFAAIKFLLYCVIVYYKENFTSNNLHFLFVIGLWKVGMKISARPLVDEAWFSLLEILCWSLIWQLWNPKLKF